MAMDNGGPREFTIGLAGAAGDGLDRTGYNLANVCSRMGLHVFAYSSYQSLIRGGHTWLRLRISEAKVTNQGDQLHVVIALNQDSIERHASELEPGGVLLYNSDRLNDEPDLLTEGATALGLPFKELTKDLGKLLPIMQNTMSVGALIHLIGLDFSVLEGVLRDTFGKKGDEIVQQNTQVARVGYDYAASKLPRMNEGWSSGRGKLAFLTGNQAIALGGVAAGLKLYAAYPMSPASSILHWYCEYSRKVGVVVKQMEDEIAVANLVVGAGHAGVRAMCATSGGGFALMTEAIGMAGMIEAPSVFINVMRGGPSTGLPTKTEQADLNQAIGASQGDFPRLIMAPGDVVDCYYDTVQALNLAEKYQIPVIILSDLLLAEHRETVEPAKLSADVVIDRGEMVEGAGVSGNGKTIDRYRRYELTKSGVSPRKIPGRPGQVYVAATDDHDEDGILISDEHTNASMRRKMQEKRMRKMDTLLAELPAPELYGPEDADVTLVGWGSTVGAIREAVDDLAAVGVKANHLQIKYLVPFQEKEVTEILNRAKKTVVIEASSSGQFARHLRAETGITVDAKILKYTGEPFGPAEIVAEVQDILAGREKDLLVTEEEASEMAYHYIRVHLRDRARPVRITEMATNGYGEPVWQIDIVDRKQGTPLGQLFIGRDTGSTHDWRPLAV